MMNNSQPIGFFALWRNKPSEYHAEEPEKGKTLADIQDAFSATREKGTKIFTNFETRWSTERQYFAFWETPSFPILEDAMNHLERAGDFKFAESEHIIGIKVNNSYSKEVLPDVLDKTDWLGCFIIWRWRAAFYHADEAEKDRIQKRVQTIFEHINAKGAEVFGYYDCRYATKWDRFAFCLLPDYSLFEDLVEQIESADLYKYAEIRQVIGKYAPKYRFARNYLEE